MFLGGGGARPGGKLCWLAPPLFSCCCWIWLGVSRKWNCRKNWKQENRKPFIQLFSAQKLSSKATDDHMILHNFSVLFAHNKCISQFQLCLGPPPPPGYCGAFACLVSPGGGAFANFVLPGGQAFANPGPTLYVWQAHGFLSEHNYTEHFTGKTSRLAHLSRMGKNWRGL